VPFRSTVQYALRVTPLRLVILVCAAQVCAQIGAYTWPALLPTLIPAWGLSNSEAGWVTGLFYAAYTVSVPILVTLTDRIDPRSIYLMGVALTVGSHLWFGVFADGFWGAAAARAIAGVGWAGTYMTGLKLLADRVEPALMSRAVAGHAASIGIAGSLSFALAGGLGGWVGWRGAFVAAAACAAAAWLVVAVFAPPAPRRHDIPRGAALFDFRPVLRNRSAVAYAVAYCVHTWEMNAVRGWVVAFLAYVAHTTGGPGTWIAPTVIATAMGLVGTWASVAGNELSMRLGRQRLVRVAMTSCIVCAAGVGFLGSRSYALAALLTLGYGALIWLDSSSLTAGAAGSADPNRRGATLALHSMFGYAGGMLGPLAIGWILDLAGGMSPIGWGLAFLHLGVVVLIGELCFTRLRPGDLAGDRAVRAVAPTIAPGSRH
jgi:predicted MFS family arabinose efflux permease